MALNKIVKATLKMLSMPDIDSKKNFLTERALIDATHRHYLRPEYRIWDHKISAGDHDIPVRIFAPRPAGRFPVLLFFHGGGWVTGNIDSYDKMCSDMAAITGHKVVSVDYQLAPEHRFPAGLEDCYLVARELFLHGDLIGARPDQITLIGDSAGANLAAAVCLMAKDRGEFMPQRQILLYPATYNDHSDQSPYVSVQENGTDYILTSRRIRDYMELYRSCEADLENPYFAPLLAKDLSGQPRTMVITAQYDPLRDEGEAYGNALRDAGCYVEIHRMADCLHGFFSRGARIPPVKRAYRYINHFLTRGDVL